MVDRVMNTVVKFKRPFRHGRNGLAFLLPKSWLLSAGISQATLLAGVFNPLKKTITIHIAEDQNMKGDEDTLEQEYDGEENRAETDLSMAVGSGINDILKSVEGMNGEEVSDHPLVIDD